MPCQCTCTCSLINHTLVSSPVLEWAISHLSFASPCCLFAITAVSSSSPHITSFHLRSLVLFPASSLLYLKSLSCNSIYSLWILPLSTPLTPSFCSLKQYVDPLTISPLLATLSPPLHALVYDVMLISSIIPVTEALQLHNYILFTSSARMLSFYSYFPTLASKSGEDPAMFCDVEISGLMPIPRSSFPLLFMPDSLFAKIFMEDGRKVTKLNGVLVNTFEGLEEQSLEMLNGRKVLEGMPSVFAVGPFPPCEFERREFGDQLKWLDEQPARSVFYVSFGSRTTMSRDQIREVGEGLIKSGCLFLWVIKDKIVDKEEEEGLDEIVGHELMVRMKAKGLVMKKWVDQPQILGHSSVGGFVSHCGWNSVIEAAWHGVPVLAWPQGGDQKINAEVVEASGVGMWVRGWSEEVVVKGGEIGGRIREMMGNELLRGKVTEIREEARKALGDCGSIGIKFKRLIEEWKNSNKRI